MRLLILSCNTGEGHNSTAKAIIQAAESDGAVCEMKDALSYWPAGTNSFICGGHVFLYRNAPELFGAGYRFFEVMSEKTNEKNQLREQKGKEPARNAIFGLAKLPAEKLYADISAGDYDAVICVHVFASLMMTEIRRKYGDSLPTYFVATDYTCSPGVNISDFNACFIPAEGLIPEFSGLGVKPEKLIPTGIPIRADFYTKLPADEAKEKLGLPKDRRIVLFMCGSMGVGPMKETVGLLLESMPSDAAIAVICGRNEKLKSQMEKVGNNGNLFVIGYTKEVCTYMDAASLIITKAGGLSSTEAATKHLPMVFIDAIPGLEVHNRDFFCDNGCAVSGETAEEISSVVCALLNNDSKLNELRNRLAGYFTHRAADEIYGYIKAECRG